jgi:2-keto-3-deoxy-L-rhamnonate aldolase RhmA
VIIENRAKKMLADGSAIVGVFLTIPSPRLVELIGYAGADYLVIDAEHGLIDVGAAEDMIRAAELSGVTPVVRVPSHDPKLILRYLESGAQGVMAPQVNTAEAARAVVDAVRYPPDGQRGLGPGRASRYGGAGVPDFSMGEYAREANRQILTIVQLEHVDALKELPQIMAVSGIDAFEIGTADLSASMGMPGNTTHPDVLAVVEELSRTVIENGRILGDTISTPEAARDLIARGFRMVNFNFARFVSGGMASFIRGSRADQSVRA